MNYMFNKCSNLSNLDLSGFDTSKVIYMSSMFSDCSNLNSLDLSSFDTSKVTYMGLMFSNCSNLSSLDLSSFDTSKVTDMNWMFSDCENLATIYTPYNVTISAALPYSGWRLPDGPEITELPRDLEYSVMIVREINTPEITKTDISSAAISLDKSRFEYTGSGIKPGVTVICDEETLQQGTDYTVSYSKNIQPGIADVVIIGIGNYTGTKTVHFTITEQKPKKGDEYTYKNVLYKVLIFTGTEGIAEAVTAAKKSITSVNVPDTVEISGYSLKVVSVKSSAFTGCTKLKTVKLGKNVASILKVG